MHLRLRSRRSILAVAAAAALLASCSSSSSSSSGVPPSASSVPAKPAVDIPAARVAAKPSAGCSATPAIAPGEVRVDTTSDGAQRWYYRHVPPTYVASKPMPVIVDLHGYLEGATLHKATTGLGPYGDTHGFITITPQGSGTKVPLWQTAADSPDVKFIGDLLTEVERTLCIDERRVFVTGYSDGAFMTSTLACTFSDRIAAVAPVDGIRDPAGCKFTRPVPVIAFHGTADPIVAYTGGLGKAALDLPSPDGSGRKLGQVSGGKSLTTGPSIPTITADWAKRNGCGTTPVLHQLTSEVTTLAFPCPAGAEVELQRVNGGGHTWPGSAVSQAIAFAVGKTTMTVSADALIWQFFEAHPLRG